MLKITLNLGDIERFERKMRAAPTLLREEMRKANIASSAELLAIVKRKLSGEVLNVRTGNLRRSWALKRPMASGDGWVGGIGSNSSYAAYHEFGLKDVVSIGHDFMRRVTSRDLYRVVVGKYGPSRKLIASGTKVLVRAHQRIVNYAGRPYARPAMEEAASKIQTIHQAAVQAFLTKTEER